MAAAERGSFLWFMMGVTQIWLSIKLLEEVDAAITTLFGAGAAACFVLGLVVFRQEQRDLLLNPMKKLQREVHDDAIAKQGKGIWFGVGPAQTHAGFNKLVLFKTKRLELADHFHHLHHKHFELNYGNIYAPIDCIFKSFHNGKIFPNKK